MGLTFARTGNPSVSVTGGGTDPNTASVTYGTAAEWAASGHVLAPGEPGFATDTGETRIGNGSSTWTSLPSLTIDGGTP